MPPPLVLELGPRTGPLHLTPCQPCMPFQSAPSSKGIHAIGIRRTAIRGASQSRPLSSNLEIDIDGHEAKEVAFERRHGDWIMISWVHRGGGLIVDVPLGL